jgi:hypothetical protein
VVYSKAFQTEPVTGLMIIKKAKSFYVEMKITDKCTFFKGSKKKLPVKNLGP